MMSALHAGAAFLCAGGGTGQYDVKRRDLTASAIRATTAPQDWDAPGKGLRQRAVQTTGCLCMGIFDRGLEKIGNFLARVLVKESSGYQPYTPSDPATLSRTLEPGDILLIEGNQFISASIKYLTQSTWSHAAFYVGDVLGTTDPKHGGPCVLIEVNLGDGCVATSLDRYKSYNTRICRPVGLTKEDRQQVVDFMISKIGLKYDTRNIFDLLRYFFPTPPVPIRWRRRMIAFGSGEPT